MTKHILNIVVFVMLLLAVPMTSQASVSESFGIEQEDEKSDIQISVSQSVIRITGAEGKVMEVISLTGRHVMSVRIESPAQRIELTNIPKGCYIIKVGKVVRKIVV